MNNMRDREADIREITHRNVERLVAAHKAERSRIDNLQTRIDQLETQVQILLSKLSAAESKANQAIAVAQQAKLGSR